MRIIIEDCKDDEEDTIIIKCKNIDKELLQLIYSVKMGSKRMMAFKDGSIVMLDPKEIYYFDTVDNKVFAYGEQEVYEMKVKLYELEKDFEGTDFFRSSKSSIINLSKIKSLTPAFNGRFEALLYNGEKVIISRQYVSELKKKLGL
ncbi:LytTR family DNA-binding domain-containing protein [Cellulosilyticum ruminicola]|uniref:LytTR family DNA-binding domain-containing protein n=1 Tax=Cellulosilyticum ruminicola TaxID=425254 RepID=UPI0006D01246|nr:LytTR family DNA-binding domain-containing protein [Cellulosilyticum ruminicola]